MLVIGTSAMVQPAATMPLIAKDNGAVIIEINPEPTPLTSRISTLTLLGGAGSIMPRLIEAVRRRRASPPESFHRAPMTSFDIPRTPHDANP